MKSGIRQYDKIILGAGLYGLYAALHCAKMKERILVLERDPHSFPRATYINQARVHMGYHYPRSYSTAIKSAGYFERFVNDFGFCILSRFDQVYATSTNFSWTNADRFQKFCDASNIRCDYINPGRYFHKDLCDGAFLTTEYTYDAGILRDFFIQELQEFQNVEIQYGVSLDNIQRDDTLYIVHTSNGTFKTDFLLNATYASTNQISALAGFEPFQIKYELCEIILCEVTAPLKDVGITVMDGPFFSIMPFGKTGYHSLTSVCFTPHLTCYEKLPVFPCQGRCNGYCSPKQLGNCNNCIAKPITAWPYMSSLARKYLKEEYGFTYAKSLFSMKPILQASEVDDSRPTVIRQHSVNPTFVSILSGKINTVYDLDEVL